jgi:beta-lactam-binding protein with PASTA domain
MKYTIVILQPAFWKRLRRPMVLALWLLGGGGLLLTVFGFSFYLAMRGEMRSTEVEVPDLGGLDVESASKLVEPLDLVLQQVDQRHDPAVPSGQVLQQMPPPGSSVRRGRKIKLVLSLGGQVLNVPGLVGEAARTVEIRLRQEGFMPGDEARVNSRANLPGRVISQVPPAGTPAVPKTRIHRLVSDGAAVPVWVMPDLSGLTRRQAEQWIAERGFRQGAVRQVRIGGRPAGTVVGQLPLAGYPVRSKDVVELSVAR